MQSAVFVVMGTALALIAYHFVVYPLIVISASRLRPLPVRRVAGGLPSVSLVIAAYNEERVIAGKLDNSLRLDYPRDRLQVVVVSDGSTDATNEIARRYADQGVVALHEPGRAGKSAALNRGVAVATGDIVVLSDANNDFNPVALRALVAPFADAAVGGVCGRKSIVESSQREASAGDSLYWRYESAVKAAESAIGIMTTADGEIFAVRRRLWEPIPREVINDDAEITFGLVRSGQRIVYEPAAVSSELASRRLEDDFRVKVRMIAGGFQTARRHWRQLLPPTTVFAWAFLSHKLLRWLVPILLLLVAGGSVLTIGTPVGAAFAVAQTAFYGLALLGWAARNRRELPAWQYVPLYFSLMNVAALIGLRRFLAGDGVTAIWQKAAR